ncbi:hypothetical protein KA344_00400 [bacterium]|jgi:HTH-type transcriptional regulator/antitoxin HigA|nr:hypothetical protein [bacterium]
MATEKYKKLIDRLPLIPIKDDAHLDAAHCMAQSLIALKNKLSTEEEGYLEVLLNEIVRYEDKHHRIDLSDVSPLDVLISFMEDHDLKQVDLCRIIGCSSGVASEIIGGKRELSKGQVVLLAERFKVSPAVFLPKAVALA